MGAHLGGGAHQPDHRLFVAVIEAAVGITAGVLWGYVRGLDFLFTELYNIFDNIPTAIVLILISYVATPSIWTMILGMSIKGWIEMARFIRNQIFIIRDRDYNVASRCIGTPTLRIVLRNLLPYLVSVIMLRIALTIPEAIGNEVFITYIGLGLSVETPSLGNLVNDGRKVMMQAGLRYQLLYPALILSFVTIAFLPDRQRLRRRRRPQEPSAVRRIPHDPRPHPLGARLADPVRAARAHPARHPGHRPRPLPGRGACPCGRERLRQKCVHQKLYGPAGRERQHHRRQHRLLPPPRLRPAAPCGAQDRKKWLAVRGREIAMVMQDPMTSLNPRKTIGEQITEAVTPASGLKGAAAREKTLEYLRDVGISDPALRYKQYPHEFSGGMRQRVVIAIALACTPKILLCDEPTTALDVTIQAQILQLLRQMRAKYHLTIVLITHDLGVVANVADRVAVMYAGDIVEIGTAEEVYYDPRHPYTWALLSSMPQMGVKGEDLFSIPGTPPNLFAEIRGDAFAPRNPQALKIDFVKRPPYFAVSPTHKARTWLLDPRAPHIEPPAAVKKLQKGGAVIWQSRYWK